MTDTVLATTTNDHLLGGLVKLAQPANGYRVGIDPVLLAAFADPPQSGRVLDIGCGVGAVLLCLAQRRPDITGVGIEITPEVAALAQRNIADNGATDRISIILGDCFATTVALGRFDCVVTNPPYQDAAAADRNPNLAKHRANVEAPDRPLVAWIDVCLRYLKPKGWLYLIHRADRVDAVMLALAARAGRGVLMPLWPKVGRHAKRILVAAQKDVRGPWRITNGLVLHQADGSYTPITTAVLKDGAALPPQ